MSTTPTVVVARMRGAFPSLGVADLAGCAAVLDAIAEVTALAMDDDGRRVANVVDAALEVLAKIAEVWPGGDVVADTWPM